MTNPTHTLIGILVDRSGSMASCREDMEGGLNTFIDEQAKEPGTCDVTIAQFDTVYEIVYAPTPIDQVERYTLTPRGGTALLDGMGRFITEIGEALCGQDEAQRPGKVIIAIVTDGHENSSNDWNREMVRKLVEGQRDDYQWEFVFLGANMDAVAEARSVGIGRGSTMTFDSNSPVAMASAYNSMSSYVTSTRSGAAASFSEEERADAVAGKKPPKKR